MRQRTVLFSLIFGTVLPLVFYSTQLHLDYVMSSESIAAVYPMELKQNELNKIGATNGGCHDITSVVGNKSHYRNVPCKPLKSMSSSEIYNSQHYKNATRTLRKRRLAQRKKQVLEFVHITKTGGSAVEMAGGKAGLKWGVCHFRAKEEFGHGCNQSKPDWARPRRRRHEIALRNNTPLPNFRGEEWHTPPSWFQNNPYQGAATFTIVRNPYTRIISEFYCEWFGYYRHTIHPFVPWARKARIARIQPSFTALTRKLKENLTQLGESMSSMNAADGIFNWSNRELSGTRHLNDLPNASRWLQKDSDDEIDSLYNKNHEELVDDKVERYNITHTEEFVSGVSYGSYNETLREALAPPPLTVATFNRWIQRIVKRINPRSGHMVPQSYYVFDEVNGTTKRFVDHVLKYESLHDEFADLMNRYGLEDVKLSSVNQEKKLDYFGRVRFTISDLEPSTICAINRRYAQDFKNFGYPMTTCSIFESR